ncbi:MULTISPECIES: hypothetical protein [Brevibacillus]|uniref:hypothetical protein n=1 Tax=Brevibacillus TaxID=55080 RepID=UPI001EDB0FF6|nr:hypothetical protein [Brevibacillus brevis]UKK97154.1 hypothetical protein FO446_06865 [Brevibacillus brevis]
MNQMFEDARTIIRNINWENEEPNKPSHGILIYEFLRRGSQFYDFIDHEPNKRLAVFSAADMCGIKLPIEIYEYCDELNEIKDEWLVKSACKSYLEWAYLSGENESVALKFQGLYVPIIKLFSRGGRIRYHNGELTYGRAARSRIISVEMSTVEPEDISEKTLDKLDTNWNETIPK